MLTQEAKFSAEFIQKAITLKKHNKITFIPEVPA